METNDQCFVDQLRKTLTDLLAMRETTLAHGAVMQTALFTALQHEAVRQRQRGREERATAIESRLGAQRGILAELVAERGRARIVPAVVPEDAAVIDGRVTDLAARGLPGLTVDLANRAGKPIAGIDPATTDENGFYSLQVGKRDDTPSKRLAAYLTVRAFDGRILHRSAKPVAPEVGRRLRLSVRLSRADLRPQPDCKPDYRAPSTKPSPARRSSAPSEARPVAAKEPTAHVVSEALDALEAGDEFAAIGASRAKLEARLTAMKVRTRSDLIHLAQQEEREVRDQLRLPNLAGARAFINLMNDFLEGSG